MFAIMSIAHTAARWLKQHDAGTSEGRVTPSFEMGDEIAS